MNPNY